jgi:hypothetical protein
MRPTISCLQVRQSGALRLGALREPTAWLVCDVCGEMVRPLARQTAEARVHWASLARKAVPAST